MSPVTSLTKFGQNPWQPTVSSTNAPKFQGRVRFGAEATGDDFKANTSPPDTDAPKPAEAPENMNWGQKMMHNAKNWAFFTFDLLFLETLMLKAKVNAAIGLTVGLPVLKHFVKPQYDPETNQMLLDKTIEGLKARIQGMKLPENVKHRILSNEAGLSAFVEKSTKLLDHEVGKMFTEIPEPLPEKILHFAQWPIYKFVCVEKWFLNKYDKLSKESRFLSTFAKFRNLKNSVSAFFNRFKFYRTLAQKFNDFKTFVFKGTPIENYMNWTTSMSKKLDKMNVEAVQDIFNTSILKTLMNEEKQIPISFETISKLLKYIRG